MRSIIYHSHLDGRQPNLCLYWKYSITSTFSKCTSYDHTNSQEWIKKTGFDSPELPRYIVLQHGIHKTLHACPEVGGNKNRTSQAADRRCIRLERMFGYEKYELDKLEAHKIFPFSTWGAALLVRPRVGRLLILLVLLFRLVLLYPRRRCCVLK